MRKRLNKKEVYRVFPSGSLPVVAQTGASIVSTGQVVLTLVEEIASNDQCQVQASQLTQQSVQLS